MITENNKYWENVEKLKLLCSDSGKTKTGCTKV